MSQPFSTFLCFGLVLLLLAADGNALCTISSSFVLGGKIVAVFNFSTECIFPEPFLRLSLPPVSSVDFIVIGGGGGPGTNAAGGGGAGGVVTQTVSISNGNTINFAVGSGGNLPLTQYESNGSPGEETKVTIDKISITASGGGYGGTRDFEQFGATGGPGASGGGGAGGGCNATSQTCGVPSTAGGSGTARGQGGGAGFQASPDVGCLSAGGGGGGFSQTGSDATSGQGGKGGDGYQLPFDPFMSSYVAGGGGGGITCAPAKSGLDGRGRDSYGGGGFARDGLRVNYENGKAGAVFMSFAYVCPAGTYKKVLSGTFSQSPCDPCDRGYFSSTANSSSCQMCPGGTFNDQIGASMCSSCPAGSFSGPGKTSCTPCSPGSYSNSPGQSNCTLCPPGTFVEISGQNQSCSLCSAGTFSSSYGSSSCSMCPPGSYCPSGSERACRCPISTFQPNRGASSCLTCPSQDVFVAGQRSCPYDTSSNSRSTLLKCIISVFSIISLGCVCLIVILVRSRHTFTVRPFHSGICFYIACFAFYALLKAVAVGRLLNSQSKREELTAYVMIDGCFMFFFWLVFGGDMSLIQLWMHLISQHTSGYNHVALTQTAHRTMKIMRATVAVVCLLYGTGFMTLAAYFFDYRDACYQAALTSECASVSSEPFVCQRIFWIDVAIVYYEGLCSAFVACLFTFYAAVFNGLIDALFNSDATFSNITDFQRMLISNSFIRAMLHPYAHSPCHLTIFCSITTFCFS